MDDLLRLISSKTSSLPPITLPLAPVHPLSSFLVNLTTAPVHGVYFPYVRSGPLHAVRVATVWAGLTRARRAKGGAKVGVLGDLFGYLTVCWGGGTLVAILLGTPPSWLLSPLPWQIYLPIYLALVPTGMAGYIQSTCPTTVFNLASAVIDGINRGITITAVPTLLAQANVVGTWWTTAVLSSLAITGGGLIAQAMGLSEEDWKLGAPTVLKGGVLNTMDIWGGAVTGLLYSALLRLRPELSPFSNWLALVLPSDITLLGASSGSGLVTTPEYARAIAVLFLTALYLARVITLAVLSPSAPVSKKKAKKLDKVDKEILEAVTHEKVKPPVTAGEMGRAIAEGTPSKPKSRSSTPRKSSKVKIN